MQAARKGSLEALGRLLVAFFSISAAACTETPPAGSPSPGVSAARPVASAAAPPAAGTADPWAQRGVPRIVADAQRLATFVKTDGAKRFLRQARALPTVATRTLYRDADKTHYYTEAESAALPAEARAKLTKVTQNEEDYYNTGYGSPLSYSRPLDILFAKGVSLPPGSRLLDFGYGYVGHLRLLASTGVHTTGVDVWPLLRALYSWPEDQGEITGPEGEKGSLRLIDGYFPKDPKVVRTVGTGYDVIVSKNVLKKGYIHPDRPVPHPERQIRARRERRRGAQGLLRRAPPRRPLPRLQHLPGADPAR
ncbi:MAG: hypothetical protein QM820_45405 [Minicystis sp.]